MKMPRPLRDWLSEAANGEERFLYARGASVALGDLVHGSSLGGDLAALDGACVLVLTRDQLAAAAGCRSGCARCSTAARWFSPTRRSRSASIWRGSARMGRPT